MRAEARVLNRERLYCNYCRCTPHRLLPDIFLRMDPRCSTLFNKKDKA
jgi:hypothetical protein